MTQKRDYYEVLSVEKNASKDQIKDSYRKLAMQYHPDRNKEEGAEDKFKEISEAYAVLSDDQKRSQYDTLGHTDFNQQYTYEDIFRGTDFDSIFTGFGDVFSTLFGGGFFGGGSVRTNRRRDKEASLSITLEEAAKGVEKEIQISRLEKCDTCGGAGAKPGTKIVYCPRCNGVGEVQESLGFLNIRGACPHCRGKGKHIETPCNDCNGSGLVRNKRKIIVKIPAGIDNGNQVRLRGEGETAANGGNSGDLYVMVNVLPSQQFVRDGDDLYRVEMITFPQAALGAEISVPTLEGSINVKIHSGTQPGEVVRVKGHGMPRIRGYGKGDLIVRIGVAVPEKLTNQQRTLIEQLAKESGTDVSSKKSKFRF